MTAPKHTPGPWNSEGPDDFGDHNIHEPTCRLAIGAVVPNMRPDEEVAANARLIAAAPDLLETLRFLVRAVETNCALSIAEAIVGAHIAIDKAEGKQ